MVNTKRESIFKILISKSINVVVFRTKSGTVVFLSVQIIISLEKSLNIVQIITSNDYPIKKEFK